MRQPKKVIQVEVGQVWQDNDKRHTDRFVIVESIADGVAVCRVVTPNMLVRAWNYTAKRSTKIKVTRFRGNSTGYVLADQEGCLAE